MNWTIGLLLLVGVLIGGCQGKPAADSEIALDAHGDSVTPTYRIDLDPRWTKANFTMADAVKKVCQIDAWQGCAIDRLQKALTYGNAMSPHCQGLSDFADHFYCMTMGATGAEIVQITGVADPRQFLAEHGGAKTDTAAAAAQALVKVILQECGQSAAGHGCAPTEAAAKLGSSAASIKDCASFADDWKATSCLVIGRMSELLEGAATRV
jgi:hypothetical protein